MLSIKDLESWYEEDKSIIKKVSFDLKDNSIIGLLGLNGAGKTTLINTLSGVHQKYKVSSIKNNNKEIIFNDLVWKNSRYTVFTDEQAFSYWSFSEYLPFIEDVYKKKTDKEYVQELIKGFGFEKYVDYSMKDLSTGNRKKAFLITGFALRCPLLILDEPLDGLDYLASEFLYEEIKKYTKFGSILMSSHIGESIEKTCNEVLVLQNGFINFYEFKSGSNLRSLLKEWLNVDK
ncbi:ABC transporter ATP-binding protein [uncultured Clostridium sp.]|uniref:ATP-binding cassette domain-containing protein n=1 Tax=uncultured Clostridium sp. TaxID=59620 RepID=UPI0025F59A8A|nr:ABC transporter ATP-binding protein [uncultured Clostridium sp.]